MNKDARRNESWMAQRKWDACIKAFIEVFIRRVVTKYTTATAEALDS
jgi:hypothetical protein